MAHIELSADFATDYIKRIIGKEHYQNDYVNWLPSTDAGTAELRLKTIASITGLLSRTTAYPAGGFAFVPGALNMNLVLMAGAAPTSINDLSSYSSILPNILVRFNTAIDRNGISMQDFRIPTVDTANPVVINSEYVPADASGVATWFLLFGLNQSGGSFTNSIVPFIMGTVGVVGSGSDLEIPDNSIISGQAYRIIDLRLQFPTSWTV